MIRVLVVEDSPLMAKLIAAILEEDSDISVVGIAENGVKAIDMTAKLKPNLITMDIGLPKVDGLEATKQIMASHPTPILILSSSVFHVRDGVDKVFTAMSYGALDVMEKKAFEGGTIDPKSKRDLIAAVKLLSTIHVIPHPFAHMERRKQQAALRQPILEAKADIKIVGIVASTGGPEALHTIFEALPPDFQAPVVVVQHIAAGFTQGLVDWLRLHTALEVKLAEAEDPLKTGTIYIAPADYQMRVALSGKITLSKEKAVHGFCPSGSVLLDSVAQSYGKAGIGVVLTGMGSDGANGLKKIYEAGGYTLAQNEASSAVFGMPKAAIDLGAANHVLPLDEIAGKLINWVGK